MNREKFSSLLLELRKEKNLTQQEFAELFSISFQAVSKWETGESLPDISTLEKISHFYNISINDLLEGNKIFIDAPKEKDAIQTCSNNIEENNKHIEKEKIKINLPKLIISSIFLVLFLIFSAIPSIKTNNGFTISLYNIVFSNNYSNFNYLFLFAMLAVFASTILGILSSTLRRVSRTLTSIETPLMIFAAISYVTTSLVFKVYGTPFYIFFTLLVVAYAVCLVVIKQLNENCILTKNQGKYNLIPFFALHLYLLIAAYTICYGIIPGFIPLLVFIANIVILILEIVLGKKLVLTILAYIFYVLLTLANIANGLDAYDISIVYICILLLIGYILLNIYEEISLKKAKASR